MTQSHTDSINKLLLNTAGRSASPAQEGKTHAEVREHRKRMLTAAFRLFGHFGFEEGVAGHITARDPEHPELFWVNPMGVSFQQIKASDLLLVNHAGQVVEGSGLLNGAAFTIHSCLHRARPNIIAAAHAHSLYGKSWSSLGRLLDPITQDACAFYEDHVVFDHYGGVVVDGHEGEQIASALGSCKAAILQNHGLLTVGTSVEAAVWWFIAMDRCCQAQLLAEAAGTPKTIAPEAARAARELVGCEWAGWFSFQPLLSVIGAKNPDIFH
ncbi:class II aldolase/adducin family protein [Pseudomaricurvus sp. HS19]|uniref:class II aldolase/adducin family protein n=1 Tax=Pseudomaricurvus sp. HS19 TaxID=2692626 RepID=UPI001368A24B|nr:class II aldolase/adducin family protein [Pseudomaricurvus sp. HS19]MYM62146.1 class II aldolase/adducin family protein [Pseudomaricurvus sp. HS19]